MKSLGLFLFLTVYACLHNYAQTGLFDDTRVSEVYIEIPPDSLEVIMTDVLSDHYFRALFIFDNGSGRDTIPDVGFRLRGNTSRYSQKKSFKISFNEYVPGRKYQGVKKINLNGQHNDPTLVREKLFYDTWKKAGMPERRTSFVKFFINQLYYGLYTNLEEFDKDWLQRIYGENNGNFYKCTYPADLIYLGDDQQQYKDIESGASTGGRAYDLQTNEAEDDYGDLVELIKTLNQPVDATFAGKIEQKINVDSFLKAFAIDVASGNWDDYMYNKNNYFLYHRAGTGKFEFISYDTDNTFGVDWVNRDWATRDCLDWYSHSEPRPLASQILSVPAFMEKYTKYLDTIANDIINPGILFPHIDTLKILITGPAVADSFRTLDYGYTIDDFNNGFTATIDNHTPYGIKPFLTKRYTTMLQQLDAASLPEFVALDTQPVFFPNPAEDILNLRVLTSDESRACVIYDIAGRKTISFIIQPKQTLLSVPVNDLKPGIFSLVIYDKTGGAGNNRFIKK